MARKLLLVRHAAVDAVPNRHFLGRTDVPISTEGTEQVRRLCPLVRAAKPDVCYCSSLLRARQTTDLLLEGLSLPVHLHDDLREIDFGQWECKTFDQIQAKNTRAVQQWAAFDQRFTFPDGESLGGFLARVRRMVRRCLNDPAETVLVVSHGGVIRSMLCYLLGLRPRNYVLFDIAYAACTTLDLFDGKGVLNGLNLTDTLEVAQNG